MNVEKSNSTGPNKCLTGDVLLIGLCGTLNLGDGTQVLVRRVPSRAFRHQL